MNAADGKAFRHTFVMNRAFVAFGAEQIEHQRRLYLSGIAQRQITNSPQMLLILTCHSAVDGMVAAVVGPWRYFVDPQLPIGTKKHFYCK